MSVHKYVAARNKQKQKTQAKHRWKACSIYAKQAAGLLSQASIIMWLHIVVRLCLLCPSTCLPTQTCMRDRSMTITTSARYPASGFKHQSRILSLGVCTHLLYLAGKRTHMGEFMQAYKFKSDSLYLAGRQMYSHG